MYIPSLSDQYYQNSLELELQTRPAFGAIRRPKIVDAPSMIWSKEYDTPQGKGKLLRLIQEISDYMLLNQSGIFNPNNPNKREHIDMANGKINMENYHTAEYTYGEKSSIPIRSNNFFYSAKAKLTTQIFSSPFEFTCKNISNEYTIKAAKKAAKTASKIAGNLFTEYAAASGVDVGFLEDQNISMAGEVDEILSQLKEDEKLEHILYQLIQDINYRHDIRTIERECFESKFACNSEFGMVEVINGEVIPKSLRPEQVLWIAGKEDIKTLEDTSVQAASVVDYLTFTEIIDKYAFNLNTGTGAIGLLDAIKQLRDGRLQPYDPQRWYFSEYYNANGLTSDYSHTREETLPVYSRVDYNNFFYPFTRNAYKLTHTILEQKIFFKMLVPRKYVVEINGKPATDKLFKDWKDNNQNRNLTASFTEIDPDSKPDKGTYTRTLPKVELWEATRLGHGTLIDVGRYKYTTTKGRSNYIGMPIVMQASRDLSFTALGAWFEERTNILYRALDEILVGLGHSNAIIFDESVGGDPKSFLYNARKSGIAIFNSQRMAGNNPSKFNHMDIMSLGSNMADANNILAMIGMLKIVYENMVGASPQSQGVAQDYAGLEETRLNIQNQAELAQPKFNEHYLFMNQLLQRIADVAKKEYANDEYKNIRVSKEGSKILKLSSELANTDPDIMLKYGPDLKNKKRFIDNAITQLMSAGGVEFLEPLINMYVTDDPNEALAILRANTARLAEAQAARDKQAAEANRLNAQAQMMKNQIPVDVAKVNQETAITTANIREQGREVSDRRKGEFNDVKHYQDQSNRVLESDLRMDEKNFADRSATESDATMAEIDDLILGRKDVDNNRQENGNSGVPARPNNDGSRN
jgi:hypothetical protein